MPPKADTNTWLKRQYEKLDPEMKEKVITNIGKSAASAEVSSKEKLAKHKMDLDYRKEKDAQRRQDRLAKQAARSSRQVAQGAVTVQGAILGCIVSSVILLAIIVSLGPLVDFFQAWLMNQPGNPYVAPVLDLFPWIYIFIFLSWIVSIVVIWRAATVQGSYGVYD